VRLILEAKSIRQNIFKFVQDFVVSCHIGGQNTPEKQKRYQAIIHPAWTSAS